jgi:hypothetical protein
MSLLKVFDTVSSYASAKGVKNIGYPNISFVDEDSSVRYINKPSWITITYDVTDDSYGVYLFNAPAEDTSSIPAVDRHASDDVYKLVIDGSVIEGSALAELRNNWFYYEFDLGIHTVEYHFIDGDVSLNSFKGDNDYFVIDIDFSNFNSNVGSAYWAFRLKSDLYVDASNIDFSSQFNGNGDVEGMFYDPGMVYINGNGITNTGFYYYLCPGSIVLVDINYLLSSQGPAEGTDTYITPVFPKSRVYYSSEAIENMGGSLPYSLRNGMPLPIGTLLNLNSTGEDEWVSLPFTGVYDYLSDNLDIVNSINGEFCRKNGEYIVLGNGALINSEDCYNYHRQPI